MTKHFKKWLIWHKNGQRPAVVLICLLFLQVCSEAYDDVKSGKITVDLLHLLCNLSDDNGKYYVQISQNLLRMKDLPVMNLLEYKPVNMSGDTRSDANGFLVPIQPIEEFFAKLEQDVTLQSTVQLIYAILLSQVKPTFHKINVHAAMTPDDVRLQLEPAIHQAYKLQERFHQKKLKSSLLPEEMPFVTVRNSLCSITIIDLDSFCRSSWMKLTHLHV